MKSKFTNGQAKREDYFYSVACKLDSGESEKKNNRHLMGSQLNTNFNNKELP